MKFDFCTSLFFVPIHEFKVLICTLESICTLECRFTLELCRISTPNMKFDTPNNEFWYSKVQISTLSSCIGTKNELFQSLRTKNELFQGLKTKTKLHAKFRDENNILPFIFFVACLNSHQLKASGGKVIWQF